MLLLKVIIVILLLTIFIQDMRFRAVYWILFPLLAVCLLTLNILDGERLTGIAGAMGVNLIFLAVQFALLYGYFFLKNGALGIAGLMGTGDMLLLGVLTCFLSPLNYIFFYIGSLLLTLCVWLPASALSLTSDKTIPLAGSQALILALLVVADNFTHWALNNDERLWNILTR